MKILHTLIFILIGTCLSFAQDGKGREKLEAYRIQFLTEEMNLSPEEAQLFWPLYNEYREKMENLQKQSRQMRMDSRKKGFKQLSEKEKEVLIREEFKRERAKINLREEYFQKFKDAMGIDKVMIFYRAEKEFQRKLLHQLSKNREERRK